MNVLNPLLEAELIIKKGPKKTGKYDLWES
jgi:hypothetical protein